VSSWRRGVIVIGLLIATLAVGALALPPLGDMGDRGVGIIEFELARTSEKAAEYYGELGEKGRDAARESLYLDYPYLLLYALFYGGLCGRRRARRRVRQGATGRPGRALAIGALAAAAFKSWKDGAEAREPAGFE
jgi:hypothetical protein